MSHINLGLGEIDLPRSRLGNLVSPDARSYSNAAGLPELRQHIAQQTGFNLENVTLTTGASMALAAILASLETRKSLLLPRPYYPAYPSLAHYLGYATKFYSVHECEELKIEKIMTQLDQDVSAILLNSPGNPVGNLIDDQTVLAIADLALAYRAPVILDAVYRNFSPYREHPLPLHENLIIVDSFSKRYGMPGERLGYVMALEERIEMIRRAHWAMTMSPPIAAQKCAIQLITDQTSIWLDQQNHLEQNRILTREILLNLTGLKIQLPKAGPFMWIDYDLPSVPSTLLSEFILASEGVSVHAGTMFGDQGSTLRVNISVSKDTLTRGIEGIARAILKTRELS